MPAKNAIKTYVENGYYHIYNRGVNKANIFLDKQDCRVFLSYVKTYLSPKDTESLANKLTDAGISARERDSVLRELRLNNFYGRIELVAYSPMPNHFHLLIKQRGKNDMESFMRSLIIRYATYFNKRYKRVGPVFQGKYKAVLVKSEVQLLYLSRYIHRNQFSLKSTVLERMVPSSYPVYLGKVDQDWVKPGVILDNFSESGFNSYQSFVESEDPDHELKSVRLLTGLDLDF